MDIACFIKKLKGADPSRSQRQQTLGRDRPLSGGAKSKLGIAELKEADPSPGVLRTKKNNRWHGCAVDW